MDSLEYLWSGKLGVFFFSSELLTVGFFLEGFTREDSWNKAHDTIYNNQCCEFSAREDVFTDRYLLYIKKIIHPSIDTLIVTTDDTILLRISRISLR